MLEKINKFLACKKYLWIVLIAITVIGIFFRTYNFHDWLPFNMDQGRDAILIGSVANGTRPLPLLGPEAGGTDFYLGPMPYYFQIISVKLFGNSPDKMAYPDLFSSILCIPLLFFFLRKYFNLKISLALTTLFSLSTYAITISRFAWNPNSTPFWTILGFYGILNVLSQKNTSRLFWAIIAGLAIGVGVQLHTTFLLFFPLTTIVLFAILFARKINLLKYFFIILAVSLILNIPQFIGEYRTHGHNTAEFFKGIQNKPVHTTSLSKNIMRNSSCWIESGIVILSGYEISGACEISTRDNLVDLGLFVIGIVFTFGGILLGIRYLRQEKDEDKKYFLTIIFLYLAVAYLIYIPLAQTLSTRYFVMLIFFPFIFLGLWIKFLAEKLSKNAAYFLLIFLLLLFTTNSYFNWKAFNTFSNYEKGNESNIGNVTLKEMEGISQFIISNSAGEKEVYLTGNKRYLFKSINSIRFLVEKSGTKLIEIDSTGEDTTRGKIFRLHTANKEKELSKKIPAIQYVSAGRFLVYLSPSK
ncbi:MAG: glycosyltransferase family 39 protein [Candidatus Moraniibacteriota bacterium]